MKKDISLQLKENIKLNLKTEICVIVHNIFVWHSETLPASLCHKQSYCKIFMLVDLCEFVFATISRTEFDVP